MLYLRDLEQVLILVYCVRPLRHLAGPDLRIVTAESGERSGSVVESLTRDGGATGSSFTSVLCCVIEQDTLILA